MTSRDECPGFFRIEVVPYRPQLQSVMSVHYTETTHETKSGLQLVI